MVDLLTFQNLDQNQSVSGYFVLINSFTNQCAANVWVGDVPEYAELNFPYPTVHDRIFTMHWSPWPKQLQKERRNFT